ncbi:DUF6445 family protein [Neptunicella marina]|uniref:Uncharacterized protein n=1 Tax=Neptunicella marina TaxID=2125989 RepID=A0A8J6M2E0_9ALTE|nr:DUF6445 family protein [Neptunicella marina]MBC3766193.1 hypothetical protein [Neptunicella marina]
MQLSISDECKVSRLHYGDENLPMLVFDNFIAQAPAMIEDAASCHFEANSPFYPGIRAKAPMQFAQLLLQQVSQHQDHFWGEQQLKLGLSVCHYSLVTTPPNQLKLLQRIPHFDAVEPQTLAAVFYLFHDNQGGTAFYRHRKTGYEFIDESRRIEYFQSLESENGTDNIPKASDGYINGDTALFEQIHHQPGLFNRMIVYRRNCLHSGVIPAHSNFSADPRNGRLSISSFIDPHQ